MGIQINGQTDTVTSTDGSINVGGNVTIPGVLTYEDVTTIDSVGIITARSGIHVTGGSVGIGTDNPTETLTVNHANGASIGLEYSGIENGTINVNSAAMYVRAGTGKHLILGSNGTEKLRITSDGKIGIGGETSPEFKVTVYDAGYSGVTIKSNRTTATDNIGGLHFKTQSTNVAYIQSLVDGSIKFRNTSSLTERLRIDSSGFIKQKFTSNNSTTAEGLFINNLNNGTGNNASLILSNDSGERKKAAIALIDAGSYGAGDLVFALDGADSGELHLTNDEKLRITSAGHVGIDNTDPRTGLTITKTGTAPTPNTHTYPYPAGNWVTNWGTNTGNADYWAGFGAGGYGITSGTVNIALAPNHNNTGQQAGMYIAGEATSASSSDFTIGKIVAGSATGSSDVAGNQRATKSELMRIDSTGNVILGYAGSSLHFQNGFNNSTARIQNGGGSNSSELKFLVKNAGTESEKMRLTSTAGLAIVTAGSMPANAGSETLYVMGEGHTGHGTSNTRSVASFIGAISSNNSGAGVWIGARTDDNTAVIGTRTASGNLAIETYSGGWGERLRITNDGYLGINNTNPRGIVHIGADLASGATDAAAINLKQTSTNETTGIYLERSGERKGFAIYVGGGLDSLNFQRNKDGTKSDVMTMTRDAQVGIKNTSPTENLHIDGAFKQDGHSNNVQYTQMCLTMGSGTHTIFTLSGNGVDATAIAVLEYVSLYAYAGTSHYAGIKLASTRRSNSNTAWTNIPNVNAAGSGNDSNIQPNLFFQNGVLMVTVGSSIQISGTIRLTTRRFSVTRNWNAG